MKQTQTARRNRKHYSASKIRNPKGKQHEPISVECQNIFLEGGLNTEDRISRTRNRHQLKPTQQCKTTPEGGQRPERKDSRRGGQGWNAVPRHACPLPLSTRACPPSAATLLGALALLQLFACNTKRKGNRGAVTVARGARPLETWEPLNERACYAEPRLRGQDRKHKLCGQITCHQLQQHAIARQTGITSRSRGCVTHQSAHPRCRPCNLSGCDTNA